MDTLKGLLENLSLRLLLSVLERKGYGIQFDTLMCNFPQRGCTCSWKFADQTPATSDRPQMDQMAGRCDGWE
jgi:hypothetical protein